MVVLKKTSQLNVVNTQSYNNRATRSRKKVLENLKDMVKADSFLLDFYSNGTTVEENTTRDENNK